MALKLKRIENGHYKIEDFEVLKTNDEWVVYKNEVSLVTMKYKRPAVAYVFDLIRKRNSNPI